jgi:hypothetical protein
MRTKRRFPSLVVFVAVCALASVETAVAETQTISEQSQTISQDQSSAQTGAPGAPGQPSQPGSGANNVSSDLSLRVTSAPAVLRAGRAARWKLEVRNVGTTPITLSFPTSQRGEVLLWGGSSLYDYAAEHSFSTVTANVTLKPKAKQAFMLSEARLPLSPGRYQFFAGLTSNPAPASVSLTVTVRR